MRLMVDKRLGHQEIGATTRSKNCSFDDYTTGANDDEMRNIFSCSNARA
jgi:hypothetical protein